MTIKRKTRFGALTAVAAAAMVASLAVPTAEPAHAQMGARAQTANDVTLSVGRGQLVNLPSAMSDLFVADSEIADVQVRSSRALYIFGKAPGETTVYATNAAGNVVYSTTVRVGTNLNSVSSMLSLAMPEASIVATPMNGLVLLTGTVASPSDVQEAQSLVQAFVGEETQVVSRLRTATPLQVNLQVRIAEVSRSVVRDIGVNLATADSTGGFQFGITRGRGAFPQFTPGGPVGTGFTASGDGTTRVTGIDGGSTIAGLGSLFGLDIASALDLAETEGQAVTLAEPNLTALSGETASFLAGGEFPIPLAQGLGAVSVEYKQFGVSLAFTPVVLANGRISMRVRPEVSELSDNGAVEINGFTVPALTTRRTETTVELGSGQSFMIAGLMQHRHNSSVERTPGLGDVPILGALFRSNRWRREETELVIVVTPYLVQPVSASQIALPTDGYRSPSDLERVFLGRTFSGESGATRPGPTMAPPTTVQPGMETGAANQVPAPAGSQQQTAAQAASTSGAAPGFSFND
ncbi:MAG: type II and III secretion system protein family protein [Pseudomonadota bacterium]